MDEKDSLYYGLKTKIFRSMRTGKYVYKLILFDTETEEVYNSWENGPFDTEEDAAADVEVRSQLLAQHIQNELRIQLHDHDITAEICNERD